MKIKYLLGRCGIFCGTDCEVYRAAHSDDDEMKRKAAQVLEQELGIVIDAASLSCEGCQGLEEEMWVECGLCLIRQCGKEQEITMCTECQQYLCQVLRSWLSRSESAPRNLEEISIVGLHRWIKKKLEEMKMV